HSLSRGNVARSRIVTRAPARASTRPATAPAGPPPTITTSRSPNDDGAVLGTEAETVAERRLDLGLAPAIGYHVEVAPPIRLALIDGRRQESARERQRRGDDACRARRALRTPGHRCHRRPGAPPGRAAEPLPHAPP